MATAAILKVASNKSRSPTRVKRAGSAVMTSEENTLNPAAGCLRDLLAGPGLDFIQEFLPAYLVRQRWFGAKSRTIASVRVLD